MSDTETSELGEQRSLLQRSGITALPRAQILFFCVVRLSDPLLYFQALPYLNEFVYSLRPAENAASVGFYVGLSVSEIFTKQGSDASDAVYITGDFISIDAVPNCISMGDAFR